MSRVSVSGRSAGKFRKRTPRESGKLDLLPNSGFCRILPSGRSLDSSVAVLGVGCRGLAAKGNPKQGGTSAGPGGPACQGCLGYTSSSSRCIAQSWKRALVDPGFPHRPEPKWHFFALSQAIFALRALTPAQIQLILNIKVYLGVEQTQRSTK